MEICEMFKEGKVYKIYLSRQIAEQMTEALGREYKEGDEITLCGLDFEFECPYRGNIIVRYLDSEKDFGSKKIEFYICETKGIISNLEKNIEKIIINN